MNRFIYSQLLRVLAPAVWASMAWSAWRSGVTWDILSRERFGGGARGARPVSTRSLSAPVWVHAVSVGETRAAEPLIRALLARGDVVLLTHTTPTGRQTGRMLFASELERGHLQQAWLPYDFPGACRRFLARHQPRLCILIEREVWPNMVAACRRAGVPVALVSARLSERGLRRARRLGSVLEEAYSTLDHVCAQSQDDAARLLEAGVRHVEVCGNLKFDVSLDAEQLARGRAWREALGRPVVTLVSTREGEDDMFARAIRLLPAFPSDEPAADDLAADHLAGDRQERAARGQRPDSRLDLAPLVIWVPRHAQRFDEVARAIARHGLKAMRRSESACPPGQGTKVYLGDTLGEMAFYLGASDVAVIGGSFAPLGSQSFIEACAAGVPAIIGPSVFNFQDAARDAVSKGVIRQVSSADQALQEAAGLCSDEEGRSASALRALTWMSAHMGATQSTLNHLAMVSERKDA